MNLDEKMHLHEQMNLDEKMHLHEQMHLDEQILILFILEFSLIFLSCGRVMVGGCVR